MCGLVRERQEVRRLHDQHWTLVRRRPTVHESQLGRSHSLYMIDPACETMSVLTHKRVEYAGVPQQKNLPVEEEASPRRKKGRLPSAPERTPDPRLRQQVDVSVTLGGAYAKDERRTLEQNEEDEIGSGSPTKCCPHPTAGDHNDGDPRLLYKLGPFPDS